MADQEVFNIRFAKKHRISFFDGKHEMTIPRRRDRVREETARQLSRALGDGSLVDPETIRLLGQNLYELIFFNAHANEWFERVFEGVFEEATKNLRLVIECHTDEVELMAYPWEFLYVPKERWKKGGRYLVQEGRLSLVRRVRRDRAEAVAPGVECPKFLVVDCLPGSPLPASSAAGQSCSTPPSEDIDKLMGFLEKHKMGAEVDCLRFPTQVELSTKVGEFKPTVVHLIGHGAVRGGDGGPFEFLLRPGKEGVIERWETDERIAEAIVAHVPQLVVLHTCRSGAAGSYRNHEGAALAMVKRGVPNVVALQHEMKINEARGFVWSFYEALALGRPMDLEGAIKGGRQALREVSPSAFGVPVVYVQREEGFSLPPLREEQKNEKEGQERERAESGPGGEARPAAADGASAQMKEQAGEVARAAEVERAAIPARSGVPEETPAGEGQSPLRVRLGR